MSDKVQFVMQGDVPVAVVLSYQEYQRLTRAARYHSTSHKNAVPQEVAENVLIREYSPIKAWRTYLGLSQKEVAKRLDMTQAAFSQIENSRKNQTATLEKVASAFNIAPEQLDLA